MMSLMIVVTTTSTMSTTITDDDNRELKQWQRQREGQKSNRVRLKKKTALHVHHAFLYISLPSLHDYNVKVRKITFCRRREHGQQLSFSLPEL